jgi:hypothetical protein
MNFSSRSWIDFLMSHMCVFESSLRSSINFKARLLNSLAFQPFQYLWIQLWGIINFCQSHIALFFTFLMFLHCDLCICWDGYLFQLFYGDLLFRQPSLRASIPTPIHRRGEKADSSDKDKSKINQIVKCSKNKWGHQLCPQ